MGDQVLIEFGFLDSFTNHCDPLSSFASQDGTNVLTVTVHAKIAMRGDWPDLPGRAPMIENGNYAFAVQARGLDSPRDKVLYRDDKGLHPIDFAGVRDEPFGPYVPVNSDPFQE